MYNWIYVHIQNSTYLEPGWIQAMICVLALPPRESCNSNEKGSQKNNQDIIYILNELNYHLDKKAI